jgi:hypothetical protein
MTTTVTKRKIAIVDEGSKKQCRLVLDRVLDRNTDTVVLVDTKTQRPYLEGQVLTYTQSQWTNKMPIATTPAMLPAAADGDTMVFDGTTWTARLACLSQLLDVSVTGRGPVGSVLAFDGSVWRDTSTLKGYIPVPATLRTNQYLRYNGSEWECFAPTFSGLLAALTDVDISGTTKGHALVHNGSRWVNSTLNHIVSPSALTTNQFLKYDGTVWVCATPETDAQLSTLTDVNLGTNVTAGQVLVNNGTTWTNSTLTYITPPTTLVSDQFLVYTGTKWECAQPKFGALAGVSVTSNTRGQVLVNDGTKWTNSTLDYITPPTNLVAQQFLSYTGTTWECAAPALGTLDDVAVSDLTSGQILVRDGSTWVNRTPKHIPPPSTLVSNQFLWYSGTSWECKGPALVDSLTDVSVAGSTVGQVLVNNGSKWVNSTLNYIIPPTTLRQDEFLKYNGTSWECGVPVLSHLSDVTVSSNTAGHVLVNNGANWVNSTLGFIPLPTQLNTGQFLKFTGTTWECAVPEFKGTVATLTDVSMSPIVAGQVLITNGTKWVNSTLGHITPPTTLNQDQFLKYNGTTWECAMPSMTTLSDVTLEKTVLSDGQPLVYSSGKWRNNANLLKVNTAQFQDVTDGLEIKRTKGGSLTLKSDGRLVMNYVPQMAPTAAEVVVVDYLITAVGAQFNFPTLRVNYESSTFGSLVKIPAGMASFWGVELVDKIHGTNIRGEGVLMTLLQQITGGFSDFKAPDMLYLKATLLSAVTYTGKVDATTSYVTSVPTANWDTVLASMSFRTDLSNPLFQPPGSYPAIADHFIEFTTASTLKWVGIRIQMDPELENLDDTTLVQIIRSNDNTVLKSVNVTTSSLRDTPVEILIGSDVSTDRITVRLFTSSSSSGLTNTGWLAVGLCPMIREHRDIIPIRGTSVSIGYAAQFVQLVSNTPPFAFQWCPYK